MLNQSQKKSKLALTRAKLRSMHSELSYGLSFAPKLQRVATIDLSGSHQPTPDPSFSQLSTLEISRRHVTLSTDLRTENKPPDVTKLGTKK